MALISLTPDWHRRNSKLLRFVLALLALFPACSPQQPTTNLPAPKNLSEHKAVEPSSGGWFAAHSVNSFVYSTGHRENRYSLLETVGGGVGLLDMDLDGDLDFYFAGGGDFRDDGDLIRGATGRMCECIAIDIIADRTINSRTVLDTSIYSHGIHIWDFDQDGFPDIVVSGFGGQALLRNLGDGTFEDQTVAAALDFAGWSTASVSGDFNRDGLPDLYIARYCQWSLAEELQKKCNDQGEGRRDSCPPQAFAPENDLLFFNEGDGTFSNQSHRLKDTQPGRGLGVVAADFNIDGKVDIYVANDAGANLLYLNTAEDVWNDSAMIAGVSGNEFGIPEGSMGIATGDVDGNSELDLLVTNFELENNSLYLSVTPGLFRHATMSSGLGGAGFQYVGFGTGLADFDGDGWQDLIVLNGNVFYHSGQTPYLQPPLLYKNKQGKFANLSAKGGEYFRAPHAGRGLAIGDLDNNGTPDFIAVDQEQPPTIALGQNTVQNWARVELRSRTGSNPPIGSSLQFNFQGKLWTRWCTSGEGYLSSGDPRILIPVDAGADSISVTIVWPSGKAELFDRIPVRTCSVLIEDQGVQTQKSETR